MFKSVALYRGELSRSEYGLLSLALALLTGTVIALFLLTMVVPAGGRGVVAGGPMLMLLIGVGVPFAWISFSIQAARLRDIGFQPMLVIGALIAANILITCGMKLSWSSDVENALKAMRGLGNAAYFAWLLFTPGFIAVPRPADTEDLGRTVPRAPLFGAKRHP